MMNELFKKYGIALTGGIATGKSTVGKVLSKQGFIVIDADQLARTAVAAGTPGYQRLVAEFGPSILNRDGTVDRKALGKLVFEDEARRATLEAITHPEIQRLLKEELHRHGLDRTPRIWFYEAALIFEKGRQDDFREVWVTYCPEEEQVVRLMQRDGLDRDRALAVIQSQMSSQDKRDGADFVIDTAQSAFEQGKTIVNRLNSLN